MTPPAPRSRAKPAALHDARGRGRLRARGARGRCRGLPGRAGRGRDRGRRPRGRPHGRAPRRRPRRRETALGALVEACSPNLFGDAAVVVARNAESADEPMVAALLDAAAAGDVRHRRAAPRRGEGPQDRRRPGQGRLHVVAPCEKAKGRAVDDFIARELHTARRKATPDAVEALRVAIGDDLRALSAACAQLVERRRGRPAHRRVGRALLRRRRRRARLPRLRRRARRPRRRGAAPQPLGAGQRPGRRVRRSSAAVASGLRGLARVASIPRGTPDAEVAREAGVPPFKVRSLREQAGALAPRRAGRGARRAGRGRRRGQGPRRRPAAR